MIHKRKVSRYSKEICILVAENVELQMKSSFPYGKSLQSVLSHAQNIVVPKECRLKDTSLLSFKNLPKDLKPLLTAIGWKQGTKRGIVKTVPIASVVITAPKVTVKEPTLNASVPTVTPDALGSIISQLVAQLRVELRSVIRDELRMWNHTSTEEILTQPTEVQTTDSNTRSATKQETRRVLVVGLLPQQMQSFATNYSRNESLKTKASFRFWTDDSTHQLKQYSKWADCVVVMTKFISHSTEGVIRSQEPRNFVRCNGGVTDLVDQVSRYMKAEA